MFSVHRLISGFNYSYNFVKSDLDKVKHRALSCIRTSASFITSPIKIDYLKEKVASLNKFLANYSENFKNLFSGMAIGSLVAITISLQRRNIQAIFSKNSFSTSEKIDLNSLLKVTAIFAGLFGGIFFLGTKKNDESNKTVKMDQANIDDDEKIQFSTEEERFQALMKAIKKQDLNLVKRIVNKEDQLTAKHRFQAAWSSQNGDEKNEIRKYLLDLFYQLILD